MKRQFIILASFVALVALEQAFLIGRAVVPAQDAVRYMAMAQMIDAEGILASLLRLPEQPLFPILVLATHRALTTPFGDLPWAVSVQVAAALPLVLCVVAVYGTLRNWIGEANAIAGTLLFISLSQVARLGADGLSDSTQLCCFCLAIWGISVSFAACGLASRPAASIPLLSAGLALGLAILTRAESIVFLPAVALAAITVVSIRPQYSVDPNREEELVLRTRWTNQLVASGVLLTAGLCFALIPYAVLVGPRPAMDRLLGEQGPTVGEVLNLPKQTPALTVAAVAIGSPDESNTFSKKDGTVSSRSRGYPAAILELAGELPHTLQYWVGSLALVGLWTRRRAWGFFDRLAIIFSGLLIVAAVCYAARVGYLSSRHLLLLTPFAAGWGGVGAMELGGRLSGRSANSRRREADRSHLLRTAVAWSIVTVVVVAGFARVATPLHSSRAGHRLAAEWLTSADADQGAVLDTRGWTALYTGRTTYRFDAAEKAFADPQLVWLVVERIEADIDSPRGRTLRRLTESYGALAQTFRPAGKETARHDVLLYRLQARNSRDSRTVAQTSFPDP